MTKISNQDYEFIGKSVYFPKQKILAIGDLHLGYEYTFRESGSLLPATQMNQTFDDLKEILEEIKKRKIKLTKIIFLGDIKHYFAFNKGERNRILDLIDLLENYINPEDVIMLKGNHEKMSNISGKTFIDFYKSKELLFIHGDREFPEMKSKEIKYVIMGHLHPAITITDSQKIKSEKYKCFLTGAYKNKEYIILPSFFPLIEGTSLNEYISGSACIIPERSLKKFNVFIIGSDKTYSFGKLSKIKGRG